jgi:hypothetical protein
LRGLLILSLLCSAPQSLPEPVASAHSSSTESESTSDSDSSSDSESETSSSDSEENEPLETPAPEVLCPLKKAIQGGSMLSFGAGGCLAGSTDPEAEWSAPQGLLSCSCALQSHLVLFTSCSPKTGRW